MGIHSSFPTSPYDILEPDYRWFPADEALRVSSYNKLIPLKNEDAHDAMFDVSITAKIFKKMLIFGKI
jgi:hypothetical protein